MFDINKITLMLNRLFVILICLFSLFLLAWYYYISHKDEQYYRELEKNMYIDTLYSKIWKYHIWERIIPWFWLDPVERYNSICNSENRKCLSWHLKWAFNKGDYIYIYIYDEYYFNLDYNTISVWEEFFSMSKNSRIYYAWFYYIMWKKYNTPETFEDLKQFWILTQDIMNFYSLNELKNLPKEQQEILLDLKKSPRFIFEDNEL